MGAAAYRSICCIHRQPSIPVVLPQLLSEGIIAEAINNL